MNIYEKLLNMRSDFSKRNVKKSGVNKFAGYNYYELADIIPPVLELELQYKVLSFVTFTTDKAILTLVNAEKPEETLVFESPMAEATLKGAHAIQNLGAVETYQRRYLYMAAYEIVEADVLDSTQGKDAPQGKPQGAQRKQQKKLSEENSNKLNVAIKDYCSMTGFSTKRAVEELTTALGWDVSQVTDKDVQVVLNKLKEWCY